MNDRQPIADAQKQIMDLVLDHVGLPKEMVSSLKLEIADIDSFPTIEVKYMVRQKDMTKRYIIKSIELEEYIY